MVHAPPSASQEYAFHEWDPGFACSLVHPIDQSSHYLYHLYHCLSLPTVFVGTHNKLTGLSWCIRAAAAELAALQSCRGALVLPHHICSLLMATVPFRKACNKSFKASMCPERVICHKPALLLNFLQGAGLAKQPGLSPILYQNRAALTKQLIFHDRMSMPELVVHFARCMVSCRLASCQ